MKDEALDLRNYSYVDKDAFELWELKECLLYNDVDLFDIDDVSDVLANTEGYNEGQEWGWVLQLHDGQFAMLAGGCDYSGWS